MLPSGNRRRLIRVVFLLILILSLEFPASTRGSRFEGETPSYDDSPPLPFVVDPPVAVPDSHVVSWSRAGWGPLTANDYPGSTPPYSPFPWFSGVAIATYPQYGTIPAGDWESGAYVPYDRYRTGFDCFEYFLKPSQYWPTSNVAAVFLFYVGDDDQNAGFFCIKGGPREVQGQPVNVTNGNMWISQTDYLLPGIGFPIEITRFYNSMIDRPGLFGQGWSTEYDMSLWIYGENMLRMNLPDNRAVYFGRVNSTDPFTNSGTQGFYGQVVKENDGSYSFTGKEGYIYKFDSTGKLLWLKDRKGNQTTLSYDTNNNLITVADPSGRTLNLTPNANGTIQQISDALGAVATYEYDPIDTELLKTVTYQDGSKYKFEYTTISNRKYLTTVKDALDNIFETHEYDTSGRAITSERHGGVEKYTFDYSNAAYTSVKYRQTSGGPEIETKYWIDRTKGRNLVKKVEGICGCGSGGSEVTEYEYDPWLNLKKRTDALGRITTNTYNLTGDRLTETDAFGTQNWTYNAFGQVLTYKDRIDSQNTDPNVNTITNSYNPTGDLVSTTRRNMLADNTVRNETTTFAYPGTNNKGLPDSVTDERGHITKFKWHANSGLLQEGEDPYGKKTTFTYEPRGRIDTITNALGHVIDYNYFDDTQRKVEKIYPNLDKIIFKYNIRRLPESVTDERGKITTYEFDPAYRLTKITDPLEHQKQFGYNLMSSMTSYTDPLGKVTNYTPDDFDRLKEIEYPAAYTGATRYKEKFEYDKVGRIRKYFDDVSNSLRFAEVVYDDVNRKITTINAENESTIVTYNQRFQTTEVKDALNQIYQFTYNPFGQVLTQTRAGSTMSWEYDEAGNPKTRTDYLGRKTKYTFDKLNRLTEIEYLATAIAGVQPPPAEMPNPKSTYVYDEISRLTSAVNDAGTASFTYDNRNRIETTTDVFGHLLRYEYERTSTVNQQRLKLDGALYATYNFDDAERLLNIVNASDSTTIAFGYDNEDKLTSRSYPNGVNTTYEYFDDDSLKRLKDTGPSGIIFDRQYSYNSSNQISQIIDTSTTKMFGYDNANRLTSVADAVNGNESYTFDDVGNRTGSHLSSTYCYQQGQFDPANCTTPGHFNKLVSTATANYGNDANGNRTSKSEGSKRWSYLWDYENRLTKASDRKTSFRYVYDALGRQVRAYAGTKGSTKFTYQGEDVLLDDADGTVTKYLNGPGIDNRLRQTSGSTTRYFLSDHLGSTNGLADMTGSLTSSTGYDSFGNQTGTLSTRYGFTGREREDTTGLMYYRARWYDPAIGRFISEDPIGFEAGDINLFGYVQNKPVTHTDPSGLIDPLVYQDPRIYGSHPLSSEELENLQTGLDCLGAFPFLGEPFDALSGVVSYARGDYTGVTLSAASTIPFLGWGTGATKIARRADNVLPEGGVYKLIRRETGETVRAGQTNNLLRRRAEHARDPKLAEYDFVPIFRTNNYNERRGLEQILYNDSPGAEFNFRRPISPRNPKRQTYMDAANRFLEGGCSCKK